MQSNRAWYTHPLSTTYVGCVWLQGRLHFHKGATVALRVREPELHCLPLGRSPPAPQPPAMPSSPAARPAQTSLPQSPALTPALASPPPPPSSSPPPPAASTLALATTRCSTPAAPGLPASSSGSSSWQGSTAIVAAAVARCIASQRSALHGQGHASRQVREGGGEAVGQAQRVAGVAGRGERKEGDVSGRRGTKRMARKHWASTIGAEHKHSAEGDDAFHARKAGDVSKGHCSSGFNAPGTCFMPPQSHPAMPLDSEWLKHYAKPSSLVVFQCMSG